MSRKASARYRDVTGRVPWVWSHHHSEKKNALLKECRKYTAFALPYFSFFTAFEECYYVSILLIMSIEVAKLNHDWSVKDNDSSMVM